MEMEEETFVEEKGIEPIKEGEARAYLASVMGRSSQLPDCEEHLDELADLADTFGVDVVGKSPIVARKMDAATLIPKGKLDDLKEEIATAKANLLIFDDEITPAQQRNLEKQLKIAVMDRTELILEIFAQRAQTKEAQLQIELAKTQYEFPRLKRMWSHFSRQRASGGFLKGEGEKQIEIDRRLLKKKLQKLTNELKEVVKTRAIQSQQRRRSGVPTIAIVGYTNAGKSTLLKQLTGAGVLVEDKLFATLDPTTRKYILPNKQEILLSDTVGFIRKLPHTLVAAFRSTLEAALHDDILLHLIDISHPAAEEHAVTTRKLLKELGISEEGALITVLNKVDACEDKGIVTRMRLKYPKTVPISAMTGEGFEELLELIMKELASRRRTVQLIIPQSEYGLVSQLHREGNVLFESYEHNDVVMRVEVPVAMLHLCDPFLDEPVEPSSESADR